MPKDIHIREYHSMQHVTGPGCVIVTLRFDYESTDSEPIVTLKSPLDRQYDLNFNIDRYIREVKEGVNEANERYGGMLNLAEIEIVPDDYPTEGQVRYAAFKISEYAIKRLAQQSDFEGTPLRGDPDL